MATNTTIKRLAWLQIFLTVYVGWHVGYYLQETATRIGFPFGLVFPFLCLLVSLGVSVAMLMVVRKK